MSDPKQEIRIAVVMYGGVSLCIYIHGVAQEFLRLVRATSGANVNDDPVTAIYKKLADNIRSIDHPQSKEPVPTRFVIDLLSGTSAGGINAIFLAKALAIRARNLDQLRETWLEKGDMDKLLDTDSAPFSSKRSLLRGQWMYEELRQAFVGMNTPDLDNDPNYQQVGQIDLFVTTTDLNGEQIPIRLSDQEVMERVHKGSFHFEFDAIDVPEIPARGKCTTNAPSLPVKNHFGPDFDPLLAFAARCTSSFPVAFPPMKLVDIASTIGKDEYARLEPRYREFFRWVPPRPLARSKRCPIAFDDRELADGGYLDNKPFGYILDALSYRPTPLRHTRKLFYIDPFPESPTESLERPHFDFLTNARAAAMELPRYETIRQDIARVKLSNRLQERASILKDKMTKNWQQQTGEALINFDEAFKDGGLKGRIAKYGPGYGTYHFIRLMDVTDDLARIISRIQGGFDDEDLFTAIRFVARYWRDTKYDPEGTSGKETENAFFTSYDFSFRMRRLIDLLEWSHTNGTESLSRELIQQLGRLRRTRDRLCSSVLDNPLSPIIKEIGAKLSWESLKEILSIPNDDGRYKKAGEIYQGDADLKRLFDKLVATIADTWDTVFCHNRAALQQLRDDLPALDAQYQHFDFRDMLSMTYLEGSDVTEHTATEIYRVSPADGIQRTSGKKKLAGTALMDFGAFLKRDWRENDLLWGRLDASERIVNAVLPHKEDEETRNELIAELRTAIFKQELERWSEDNPMLAPAREASDRQEVLPFLQCRYAVPPPPLPKHSVKWLAQAAHILGRMFEDDLGVKGRFTVSLKTVGSVSTRMVGFLVPHTIGSLFWGYWLVLITGFFLVLAVVGTLIKNQDFRTTGFVGMAVVVFVWFASTWIGGLFEQRWQRFLGWLFVLPLATIFALGISAVPPAFHSAIRWCQETLSLLASCLHGKQ